MNENELVSVIVPVYNVEPYLHKCLNSIINQTYSNLEIFLVDDGSTDKSGDICDYYAEKDNRISVVHKSNGGHNSARKMGMKLSHGKYICIVDSDDWIEHNMVEEMMENIFSTKADFVHTGTIFEMGNKTTIECRYDECVVDDPKFNDKIWHEIMAVDTDNYINRGLARKLFRSELIKKCYAATPDDLVYGEDFLTVSRCIIECKRVSFIKKAYYHYLLREGSIVHINGVQRIYMAVRQYDELRKMFIEYNMYDFMRELLEKACAKETYGIINTLGYLNITPYIFDEIQLLRGKRIIIFGAGRVGSSYYKQFIKYEDINVVGVVDKNYLNINTNYDVNGLEYLSEIEFDSVVIAVLKENIASEIRHELIDYGVEDERIIWIRPYKIIS